MESAKKPPGRPKIPAIVVKQREIEACVRKLVFLLADQEDTNSKILLDIENTPARVSDYMVNELLSYPEIDASEFEKTSITALNSNGIVTTGKMIFTSMCSHHLLPFYGEAYLGLLPNEYVLGLSKYSRIVDLFSKRLQFQEKLASEIITFIDELIKPTCMVLILKTKHVCMCNRGIRQNDCFTVTSHITPDAENRSVIEEIQRCIQMTQS